MSYSSVVHHIWPIIHYVFAFVLLFLVAPTVIFPSKRDNKLDKIFSQYAKMVFTLILFGYLLVIIKLFEVLTLILLFLVLISYRYLRNEKDRKTTILLKRMFDLLDGLFKLNLPIIIKWIEVKRKQYKKSLFKQIDYRVVIEGSIFLLIVATSIYIRFYDAIVHVAPPMADSYVTLAWMKYIDARELFHDGIYPQGFHIYLATLFKFAAIDPLYVLKYTGPLNSLFFTIGLFIVIRKLTGNGIGGLVASGLFGIWIHVMPFLLNERQAATNSQEFAFLFILPTIYFLYQYLIEHNKEDLFIGLICTSIIGLVHSLAFALIGLFIGFLVLSALFTQKKPWKSVITVCLGAIITVILTLIPLGIGLLLGKEFHSSSAEYLVSVKENVFTFPILQTIDYVTLGFLGLLFLLLFMKSTTRNQRCIGLFIILVGLFTFFLYFAGGAITQSTLIASRSPELWGIFLPFCLGISISLLLKNLTGKMNDLAQGFVLIVMITLLITNFPKPITPYKLEHDSTTWVYLKIQEQFLPKTWLMVSQEEGYSIALGKGYHMHLYDFLDQYTPHGKPLSKISDGSIDPNLPANIFIFIEKELFKVSETNSVYDLLKPQYERRNINYPRMVQWIEDHNSSGYKSEVYYEDHNILVYYLNTKPTKEVLAETIWNK